MTIDGTNTGQNGDFQVDNYDCPGLIDPRDCRIFSVGTLESDVKLNEHVAETVAEALSGAAGPAYDRVRAILAADFDEPHAVMGLPPRSRPTPSTSASRASTASARSARSN